MLGWIKAAETGVYWPVVVLQCSESGINWHCVGDGSSASPQEILKDFCFIGNSNSSWTDFYPLIPVLLCEYTFMKQHCIPRIWVPSSYRADVNDCLFLSTSQTQWNKKWMRFSFTLCISTIKKKNKLFPVAGFFSAGDGGWGRWSFLWWNSCVSDIWEEHPLPGKISESAGISSTVSFLQPVLHL